VNKDVPHSLENAIVFYVN